MCSNYFYDFLVRNDPEPGGHKIVGMGLAPTCIGTERHVWVLPRSHSATAECTSIARPALMVQLTMEWSLQPHAI